MWELVVREKYNENKTTNEKLLESWKLFLQLMFFRHLYLAANAVVPAVFAMLYKKERYI